MGSAQRFFNSARGKAQVPVWPHEQPRPQVVKNLHITIAYRGLGMSKVHAEIRLADTRNTKFERMYGGHPLPTWERIRQARHLFQGEYNAAYIEGCVQLTRISKF